jgi:hypothetical protein
MKNLSLAIAGAVCVALGGVGSVQAATLIDTVGNGGGSVAAFGEGIYNRLFSANPTYGQTFTIGSDNVLNNFTFWLDDHSDPGAVDFGAYVMAWDGSKATGNILYQSGKRSTTGAAQMEEFTFNTGGITLISGQQYVAFINASNFFDGINSTVRMRTSNGDYSGGKFVLLNYGTDFSNITTQNWYEQGSVSDLAFKAILTSASAQPVPEPSSSLGLLAFGGFVAGKILKRKKAQLKIESQDKE